MSDTNVDPAGAAAAAAAAAAAKPWYDGLADAETVGHWQNKGYDVTSPAKIAIEATKSQREAEKLIGAPASQLLRLPADPTKDKDGMDAIWKRLGAVDAKDYDFPALKDKDGKVMNPALDSALRTVMATNLVPKDKAAAIAAEFQKYDMDTKTAAAAERAATVIEQKAVLAKEWGANAPMNKVIAQNAAKALGMTSAEIDALEQTTGYARTMEMLRTIGSKIGEDKFLKAPGQDGNNIASKSQAQARLTELKADKAWVGRYNEGDAQAKREMHDLMVIIAGDENEDRI